MDVADRQFESDGVDGDGGQAPATGDDGQGRKLEADPKDPKRLPRQSLEWAEGQSNRWGIAEGDIARQRAAGRLVETAEAEIPVGPGITAAARRDDETEHR